MASASLVVSDKIHELCGYWFIHNMDPISAAGIGLSVSSVAFQVFSGCITGMGYSSTMLRP